MYVQGEVISFDKQLINHNTTLSRVRATLKGNNQKAENHLNRCIYIAGFGSNDYINNYLMPNLYPDSRKYRPDQYAQILINKYSTQLTVSNPNVPFFSLYEIYYFLSEKKNMSRDIGLYLTVN